MVRVLHGLGGVWSLLGSVLWLVPRPLRDLGYILVTKARKRLSSLTDAFPMPCWWKSSRIAAQARWFTNERAHSMITMIVGIANILLSVLGTLVLIHVVLSLLVSFNVINTRNELVRTIYNGLESFLNPIYAPFRKIVPAMGGIDWAPFLLLITIQILQGPVLNFIAYPTFY